MKNILRLLEHAVLCALLIFWAIALALYLTGRIEIIRHIPVTPTPIILEVGA